MTYKFCHLLGMTAAPGIETGGQIKEEEGPMAARNGKERKDGWKALITLERHDMMSKRTNQSISLLELACVVGCMFLASLVTVSIRSSKASDFDSQALSLTGPAHGAAYAQKGGVTQLSLLYCSVSSQQPCRHTSTTREALMKPMLDKVKSLGMPTKRA